MDANNHSNDMVGENPSVDVGDNPTENEPIRNVQETEATETVPCEPLTSEDEIKIANLTTTVASQSSEIAELNARLVACQQHYETVLARQKDDYSREKQSTVMRYAQAEKAKLDSDKRCDTLLAKNADLTKEKENLQMKLSEFKLMNTKLQQAYDNKAAELNTTRKELEKVKELNQSIDATLKSTLNHLKGESQQLREQRELNERLKRDLNEQHEMNEQLKSQCKQLTETVQAVPTDDERTQAFDTLLNEHNSLKSQLAIVQEENNRFLEKLKSATEDHVALENVIENFRLNAVRDKETNKKLYDDLLAAREQDAIEISRLKQIENLHNQTLADNADLRQLLEKEHQHLELTQKLTEKNSVLQSNYEQLEIIHKKISEHHDSLKKINEEQHSRITQLESTETSLRDQLKDLEEKYGNLSKSHEEIVKKYDDSLIEIQTLKKKHQANTKDLIKQLQQLQKTKATAHDDGSSPALQTSQTRNIPVKENLGDHSSGRGSPTGSYSSLNDMTPPVLVSTSDQTSVTSSANNNHHHHQQQQQQQQQLVPADDEQEVVVSIVDIDRQKLIDKLLKQQKLLVRRNEKIEFLNDHIQLLTQDLQNKRKIIQAYAMNADGFMYTSNESDLAKQQLANKTRTNSASTSLMATLYNRATTTAATGGSSTANKMFDQSAPMTLETSLDIMGKLQSVLEDTLLKNITLKENVDTLSKEVEKLSKRTRK